MLGRFTSIDPVRGNPGSPQSWNLYAYVSNNPFNRFDPLGLLDQNPDGSTPDPKKQDGNCDGTPGDPDCDANKKVAQTKQEETKRQEAERTLAALVLFGSFENAMDAAKAGNHLAQALLFGPKGVQGLQGVGGPGEFVILGMTGPAKALPQLLFKSGHATRHLIGTGMAASEVEAAVANQVLREAQAASMTGSFWGRATVSGKIIEYRAYTLSQGVINVGTYYPVLP